MATDKINSSFTWGDDVILKSDAPDKFSRISSGSICGIRMVDSDKIAKMLDLPVGTVLYLVENGDGEAMEIPEIYLQRMD